jgi:hypothetical protein
LSIGVSLSFSTSFSISGNFEYTYIKPSCNKLEFYQNGLIFCFTLYPPLICFWTWFIVWEITAFLSSTSEFLAESQKQTCYVHVSKWCPTNSFTVCYPVSSEVFYLSFISYMAVKCVTCCPCTHSMCYINSNSCVFWV